MKHISSQFNIPINVSRVTNILTDAGFEAFLVGGCVRDLIMGKSPKDFDITTNAKPEQIIELFSNLTRPADAVHPLHYRGEGSNPTKVVYENIFGTVMVIFEEEPLDSPTRQIEITPYRRETTYSDARHPDQVMFADKLEDDLMRRDFTMNALAYGKPHPSPLLQGEGAGQIIDLYNGLEDIENKTIRTVGDANERFSEDALRMMRAVRFAAQLGFSVSHETLLGIEKNKELLKKVSQERIRDEFVKIINSPSPITGIGFMVQLGLMEYVIPELLEGVGCKQGGVHKYDVFEHLLHACQHAADKGYSFHVKLAALFHDIEKPRTRRPGAKKAWTFYGHEVVGARMAEKIMNRMKFPKADIDMVVKLVRNHMFFSDTEQITLSAVRRIIQKMTSPGSASGTTLSSNEERVPEHPIWILMQVRECDRVGMAKSEAPFRLRKYFAMIEEALRDPISVSQLAIDGNYLMKDLNVKPGRRMGWILHALLEEVLEDPSKNTVESLSLRVKQLEELPDSELMKLGEAGKEKKEELEEKEIEQLHVKHHVAGKPKGKQNTMTTQLTYLELLSNEQFMEIHGRLIHVSRAGWVMRGVKNPENVLDHTEDLISLVDLWEHELAIKNPDQLKIMLKIHDWPEILIGDATLHQLHGEQFLQAQAIKHSNERVAMKKLCETLGALGETLFDLWDQYEKNETHDIQIGHQLDKVQAILQALNYEQAGEPVETIGFIENALEKNQIHHPLLLDEIKRLLAK